MYHTRSPRNALRTVRIRYVRGSRRFCFCSTVTYPTLYVSLLTMCTPHLLYSEKAHSLLAGSTPKCYELEIGRALLLKLIYEFYLIMHSPDEAGIYYVGETCMTAWTTQNGPGWKDVKIELMSGVSLYMLVCWNDSWPRKALKLSYYRLKHQ